MIFQVSPNICIYRYIKGNSFQSVSKHLNYGASSSIAVRHFPARNVVSCDNGRMRGENRRKLFLVLFQIEIWFIKKIFMLYRSTAGLYWSGEHSGWLLSRAGVHKRWILLWRSAGWLTNRLWGWSREAQSLFEISWLPVSPAKKPRPSSKTDASVEAIPKEHT